MKFLTVSAAFTDAEMQEREGKYGDLTNKTKVLKGKENMRVLRPDGSLVCGIYKNIVPKAALDGLYENLKSAQLTSTLRGPAAGPLAPQDVPRGGVKLSAYRYKGRDDTYPRSKPVKSGCVGYSSSGLSYWTKHHMKEYRAAVRHLGTLSQIYNRIQPKEYARQLQIAKRTKHMPGTVFSTLAVNQGFRTGIHKDKGDYDGAHGLMVVLGSDRFEGGELMFPKYDVAVDLRVGDVIVFDSLEWHCNAKFRKNKDERFSVVCYIHTHTKHKPRLKVPQKNLGRTP